MSNKTDAAEDRKAEAIKTLRRMGVKPGTAIYTTVTHVSKSGMGRHIRCYVVTRDAHTSTKDGRKHVEHGITDITGLVAGACGFSQARKTGWDIAVHGCGMDMCFHVVYTLGRRMFPAGTRLGPDGKATDSGYLLHKRDL